MSEKRKCPFRLFPAGEQAPLFVSVVDNVKLQKGNFAEFELNPDYEISHNIGIIRLSVPIDSCPLFVIVHEMVHVAQYFVGEFTPDEHKADNEYVVEAIAHTVANLVEQWQSYRPTEDALRKRVGELEKSYVPQETALAILELLDDAVAGEGIDNTIYGMVRNLIKKNNRLRKRVGELEGELGVARNALDRIYGVCLGKNVLNMANTNRVMAIVAAALTPPATKEGE